ncbi:MAG TPA: PAS domain S-box protein, partial [Anaerolineae bacterium]|nr:PAS domain S-box protein [Anaerolineae bacterium]
MGGLARWFSDRGLLGGDVGMKRRSKDQQGKETQVERGVWESLVDTAQVLIVVLDTEGRIVLFNRACQETTGYSDEEVLGRNWFDLFLPERVKEGVGEVFQKLLAGQLPSHYENPILTKDGRERLIEWDNTFLRDEEGTVNYVIGTGRDITEYERAEGRILQQSAVLEAINKVFQETLVCVSDEDVARTCLAVAEELTSSKFGFIGEVNEAGRFDTIALSDPGWDACRIPRSNAVVMIKDMEIRGLWSRVLKNGQPLMVNDLASHPDSVGTPEGHPPLTAFLGVPLKYAGRTFGMIGVANKESGYDSTDQEALESLSVAFVEALMRKRAEEALKASQAYSRNIIDSSLDMIIAVDMDRHIVEFNKAAQETFGYRREEVLGVHVDILYADPQEGLRVHQEAIEKGQCVREILNRRKNGKVFPCLLSASVLRDARGELVGVMGVARDITERKRAEERLVKLHECFLEFGADPDENINRLVALCGEFLGATCALYNRLDGEMLYSVGQWNTPPDYNPVDKPEGRICYDVIKHGGDQVVVIRNLPETHYAQTDPNVVLYKLQTYVGQPVKFGSACVGSLCVVYQEDFVPSEEDKKLMEIVASAIGVEEKRKHAEEELRRSLEETAHSRHLLLALSRAAHAMQRARTPNEIYRTVGDEVTRLGYQATILVLTDDRTHLVMPHLAFEPALLRAVEKLTGLPAEDRRFPLSPDGIFQRIITEGEATFFEPITELIMDALPGPARPLAGRIVDLLGIEQGIVAPLAVGGEPHGLLVVTGVGLTEADVPAVTAFANQAAIAIENARLFQAVQQELAER